MPADASIWSRLWRLAKALFATVPALVTRQPQANALRARAEALAALKPLLDFPGDIQIDVDGLHVEKTTRRGKCTVKITTTERGPPALHHDGEVKSLAKSDLE